jgi:transcriptional regulator with XRE-family HTH domain
MKAGTSDQLASRIRERLSATGKSAAAVSVEAGLGRSAVADILSGNSESPRLVTIEALTGPLECSLAFLLSIPMPQRVMSMEHRAEKLQSEIGREGASVSIGDAYQILKRIIPEIYGEKATHWLAPVEIEEDMAAALMFSGNIPTGWATIRDEYRKRR